MSGFLLGLLIGLLVGFLIGLVVGILIVFLLIFFSKSKNQKLLKEITTTLEEKTDQSLNQALLKANEHLNIQHAQKLQDVLNPIKSEMKEFKDRINAVHAEDISQMSNLRGIIKTLNENQTTLKKETINLSKETEGLTKALRGHAKMQGLWGEQILEQILQTSGYLKGYHYRSQVKYINDEGKGAIPDFIIDLPEGKSIIIDAKVSIEHYSRYFETENEQEKQKHLEGIKESLKNHIDTLSQKSYHSLDDINTIHGVLMFIPIESLFTLLVEKYPDLFNYARQKDIFLTSPANLIPLIQVINHMWVVDHRNKNIMKIANLGEKIYDKLIGMTEDLDKVENALKSAQKHVESFKGKLKGKGNVVNLSQELIEHGTSSKKKLDSQWLDAIEDKKDE